MQWFQLMKYNKNAHIDMGRKGQIMMLLKHFLYCFLEEGKHLCFSNLLNGFCVYACLDIENHLYPWVEEMENPDQVQQPAEKLVGPRPTSDGVQVPNS